MSYSKISDLPICKAAKQMVIEGGQLLGGISSFDYVPMFSIRCIKHPGVWYAVMVPNDPYDFEGLQRNAETALSQCPDCHKEQKADWKNTRWPEGAEI